MDNAFLIGVGRIGMAWIGMDWLGWGLAGLVWAGLDWRGPDLCLVNRQRVARDQWQLDQHWLALARGQRFLPRSDVHVVEIWRPCFLS